tara:strand:+ start:654 stop:1952 length:1299 start_codon:yes stop_codon:yes gene_type:complete
MNKKKTYNIAVVGLGNIGSYFLNFLIKNKKQICAKTNSNIGKIFISAKNKKRKRKILYNSKIIWLKNYKEIFFNKQIDIVIELVGNAEGPAKDLVFNSLKKKKHVITANKALIAKYGDPLSKIAEMNKVNLEYEAAVCGGVPIIRSIKEGLIANKIDQIQGILNGTSNYILSSMHKNNLSFDTILNLAKKKGYAESNPISDLNGDDVASKLKILTALSFNCKINKSIHVEGIKNIDLEDIKNADNLGFKIKLLGVSEKKNNIIYQRVYPVLIKKTSYIASIDGVLNAVIIDGKPVGRSVIQGEGAGPDATTSAIISDLSSILRGNIKFPFSITDKKRKVLKFDKISNLEFSAYIKLQVKDKKGVLSKITKDFSDSKVSIKRLIQNPVKLKNHSSIVIITHKCKNIFLEKTVKKLTNKKYIVKKPKLIRIDNN